MNLSLDIHSLHQAYRQQHITPSQVIELIHKRMRREEWRNAWITLLNQDQIQPYLEALSPNKIDTLPLYGIPFSIKDNIDLANIPTTAGCPDYAYTPDKSAYVVEQLISAGAIPIGKTNLDQFATGLVGTRSPYGACPNSFNHEYISGGSSSGSAVTVALGWASFSLGTDTAGSGRVPASFNNLIGLKPTRGALSNTGVVPACRTLDCVSIFALNTADAQIVFNVAASYDSKDPYARRFATQENKPTHKAKIGIPLESQIGCSGNVETAKLFRESVEKLSQLGHEIIEVNIDPMLEAAKLLYEGPWVTERFVAIQEFLEKKPESLYPVTKEIISSGEKPSAADAFSASYRLQSLKRESEKIWDVVDYLVTPTTNTIYKIKEVEEDPIQLNSNLGKYTNFMNLLDLSAITVPAGFYQEQLPNFPFGITFIAQHFSDHELIELATPFHQSSGFNMGATEYAVPPHEVKRGDTKPSTVSLAVCGAHLTGLPLNHQLTQRNARFIKSCKTAPRYRFYALPGGPPFRPGLIRSDHGAAIEIEIWEIPLEHFGSFVANIPEPLGIGKLELEDETWVSGFICEDYAVKDAEDITSFGNWREYLASKKLKPK